MLKFNSLFFIGIVMFFSACTLKSRDNQSGKTSSSSFILKNFKGSSGSVIFNQDFMIPKAKNYHFVACLKETTYDRNLNLRDLTIAEIQKTSRTDSEGCLQWDELIEYNYFQQSHYVKMARTLQIMGSKNDQISIQFAINPWLHGEKNDEVVDLKNAKAPALIQPVKDEIAHLSGTESDQVAKAQLWIEDGRLFNFENNIDEKGLNLNIDTRLVPHLKLKKMNGDISLTPLTKGQFTAEVTIIHSVYIEKTIQRRIIGKSMIDRAVIDNNILSLKTIVPICATPSNGQVYLGIKLRPINAPMGISEFEGIFLMGEYDAIKTNAFLKNTNLSTTDAKEFKISNFAEDFTTNTKSCQNLKLDENYQPATVAVAPLDFKFLSIGKETTASKEIIYRIAACVRNSIDGKPLRGQTFRVKKFHTLENIKSEELELKTDENSCLVWNERITFQDFACQHNIKGQVTISNENRGMKKNIPMVINPWEFWGMMAQDLRYVPDLESLVLNCDKNKKGNSQINISSYTLNTLLHHTTVDSDLKLRVTKKFRISMSPDVLRYSNLSAGRQEESHLRAGLYLLKIAVVSNKGYEKELKLIAQANKIAYVTGGNLRTDFELSTTDIKSIGNRNELLLELYPINEELVDKMDNNTYKLKKPNMQLDELIAWDSSLITPTFTAPIMLDSDNSGANVDYVDQDLIANYFIDQTPAHIKKSLINQVIEKLTAAQNNEKLNFQQQTQIFAHENNLEYINLMDANSSLAIRKHFGLEDTGLRLRMTSVENELAASKPIGYLPLQNLVLYGNLSKQDKAHYCYYWFNYLLKNSIQDGKHRKMINNCVLNPDDFFITEKRLIIKKINASKKLGGYQHNINFGTTFSLSDNYSESLTRTVSGGGNIGVGLPDTLTGKMLKLNLNGSYSVSSASSNSTSQGNTVNVGAQTNLQVRVAEILWESNLYEQCLVVRLNPKLFETDTTKFWGFRNKNFQYVFDENLTSGQKFLAMTKGSMICLGRDNTDKITRLDKYFRIDQVIESAEFQDRGDIMNRRLFMMIRGEHEYQKMLSLFRSHQQMPENALVSELTELKQIHAMESILMKPLQNIFSFHLESSH